MTIKPCATITIEINPETREVLNAFSDAINALVEIVILAGKTLETEATEKVDLAKGIEKGLGLDKKRD